MPTKRSISQLINLTDQIIKKNDNGEITAIKDNSLRQDFIVSFANWKSGGLLAESEFGYLGSYRPTSPGAFASVDMIINLTDLSGTAGIDYDNTTGVFSVDGTKVPYFAGGISGTPSSSTYLRGDGVWTTVSGGVASVTGTTNRIDSTGGSNPVIDISASYVGQASITTLGTITTGVWNAGAVTSSGAVIGASIRASGTGGAGYLQLPSQSSVPTAVSGSMILYADGSNRFSIVRRNNANSADITRTHLYPDGSYDWTFPTPASGSSSTLAGLNTAQTFSSVNTFSATGGTNIYLLDIFDVASGTYKPAIDAPSGNQLRINGMGSGTGILLNTSTSVNGIVFANSFNAVSGGGNTTTGNTSLGMIVTSNTRSTASAIKTDFSIVSGNHTGAVSGANTQNVSYITGSQTNASGTGATTGSHLFAIGTIAGTGTRGGVSFFNGTTTAVNATEPAWNSGQQIIFIGNRTASPTVNATNGTYFYANSGNLETTGSFVFPLAGTGLQFKTGSNARVGTSTLTSGTITVANTSVTANTKVKVQLFDVNGGTLGAHYLYTVNPGVGFTITSVNTSGGTHTGDTAIVDWYLTEFN